MATIQLIVWLVGMFRFDSGIFGSVQSGINSPNVALTFDDGPDPVFTPRILDLLIRYKAHATFFTIGANLEKYPDIARRILAEGHELACHTATHHPLFVFLSYHRKKQEIVSCIEKIRALGGNPRYLRPPAGILHPDLFFIADEVRLKLAGWTARSYDTATSKSGTIVARIIKKIRPGGIIMLHDGSPGSNRDRSPTISALSVILETLHAQTISCVTITELITRPPAAFDP